MSPPHGVERTAPPPARVAPPARPAPAAPAPPRARSRSARRGAHAAGRGTCSGARARARPALDHFALALYYQRVGDFDNALAHYRTLLEQNDGSAEVHNNLGLLYQDQDQLDDAVKQFQRAIAIDPKYVKAHNNLGVALMRPAGRGRRGNSASRSPTRATSSRSSTSRSSRRPRAAWPTRDLLRRAVAIDPRNAGSHYNLAVVADESGDAATAIEHYRAFLRFGTVTHGDLAAQVRARLAALGG